MVCQLLDGYEMNMLYFASFNWIDGLIILLTVYYLITGWRRGFVLGMTDLAGLLFSFLVALHFYSLVATGLATWFDLPQGMTKALGFLLAGFFTEAVVSFPIECLYRLTYTNLRDRFSAKTFQRMMRVDVWLGCVPASMEGLIAASFFLTLILALPVSGTVKKTIVDSMVGSRLIVQAQDVERQLNTVFGEAVNETLTFLTVNANPISEESIDLGYTQTEGSVDESAESAMLQLVNQERASAGLQHLKMDAALRTLSRTYAKDLFARGYFSHYNPEGQSPFDRMENAGIRYSAAGENLALAPNLSLAHQGLMNSPGHRANILSEDYGRVGIGVIDGGMYGQMFVQEFTD